MHSLICEYGSTQVLTSIAMFVLLSWVIVSVLFEPQSSCLFFRWARWPVCLADWPSGGAGGWDRPCSGSPQGLTGRFGLWNCWTNSAHLITLVVLWYMGHSGNPGLTSGYSLAAPYNMLDKILNLNVIKRILCFLGITSDSAISRLIWVLVILLCTLMQWVYVIVARLM